MALVVAFGSLVVSITSFYVLLFYAQGHEWVGGMSMMLFVVCAIVAFLAWFAHKEKKKI